MLVDRVPNSVGLSTGPGGGPATLRFLRALPVGARERLVVVAYHDEELLVGVTAGQITVIDRRPLTPPPPAAEAPAGPAPAWQGRLLQLLRRR